MAGLSSMADFSFSQFRTMLSVMGRGEERDDSGAEDFMGVSSDKMSSPAKRVLSCVLWLVLCLVLFGAGYVSVGTGLDIVQVFFMMIAMLVVMVVIVGFYQAVNTLYFVKDISFYLALPVSAVTIMAAKLTYFIRSQVVVNCIVVAFGLGFLAGGGAGLADFVILVLAFLPCVIASALILIIVVIPVMRFSRVAADKDKFARVFGVLTTIVSLLIATAVNFGTRYAPSSMMSSVADIASHGVVGVVLAVVCAPTLLVSEVFGGNAALGLLGMYVLAALYVAVTALFAKKWYFAGVQGMQGGAGKKSRKRFSAGELAGAVKQRGQFKAFLSQDIATLIRVPAFFQQFVVPMILEPVGIAVIGIVGICFQDAETFEEISGMLLATNIGANTHLMLLSLVMVVGVFASLTSYICSFSLGRDGGDFFFLRAMPINMRDYVLSKFVSGFLITRVPLIVVALVALIVVGVPIDASVLATVTFAVPLCAIDLIMFAIGSKKPYLTWENEAQLFKQDNMYLYMFIAIVIGIVAYAVPVGVAAASSMLGISGYAGALVVVVLCVAELAGAAAFALSAAPKNMERVRL